LHTSGPEVQGGPKFCAGLRGLIKHGDFLLFGRQDLGDSFCSLEVGQILVSEPDPIPQKPA
jgi:hypothetical protein